MQYVLKATTPFTTLFKLISAPFIFLSDAMEKSRRINQTIRELSSLSDAELRDIGISRAQIISMAYEDVYGDRA